MNDLDARAPEGVEAGPPELGESRQLGLAVAELVSHLVRLASDDSGLRRSLRRLGRYLADLTEPEDVRAPTEGELEGEATSADVLTLIRETLARREAERSASPERDRVTPLPQTQALPEVPPPPPAQADVPDSMLGTLAARFRVKAEAARWAAQRQRLIAAGDNWPAVITGDREIADRGARLDVHLWMAHADAPVPADPATWEDLGGTLDALADALHLAEMSLGHDSGEDYLESAVGLVAEAQSATRVAVEALGQRPDEDQMQAFQWLKRTTQERQIYVPKYMRLADRASPAAWGDVRARIEALEALLRSDLDLVRRQRNEWGRLRYHLKLINAHPSGGDRDDWIKAMEAVAALVENGLPPSSVELRSTLLAAVDSLPNDLELGRGAVLALREIERYLASREAELGASPQAPSGAHFSPEVEAVAGLLAGRAMVLIGGVRRPHHAEAIASAFRLRELVWIDGTDPSYTQFEPAVARPDVAVIVLMIRWSSHGFGEVKAYCDHYGKPLVHLPAGYNPNQLAVQILSQAGDRLAAGLS